MKYGTLVAVLAVNYALKNPQNDSPKVASSGSEQDFVEKKQKKLSIFSTDNQVVSNYVSE